MFLRPLYWSNAGRCFSCASSSLAWWSVWNYVVWQCVGYVDVTFSHWANAGMIHIHVCMCVCVCVYVHVCVCICACQREHSCWLVLSHFVLPNPIRMKYQWCSMISFLCLKSLLVLMCYLSVEGTPQNDFCMHLILCAFCRHLFFELCTVVAMVISFLTQTIPLCRLFALPSAYLKQMLLMYVHNPRLNRTCGHCKIHYLHWCMYCAAVTENNKTHPDTCIPAVHLFGVCVPTRFVKHCVANCSDWVGEWVSEWINEWVREWMNGWVCMCDLCLVSSVPSSIGLMECVELRCPCVIRVCLCVHVCMCVYVCMCVFVCVCTSTRNVSV